MILMKKHCVGLLLLVTGIVVGYCMSLTLVKVEITLDLNNGDVTRFTKIWPFTVRKEPVNSVFNRLTLHRNEPPELVTVHEFWGGRLYGPLRLPGLAESLIELEQVLCGMDPREALGVKQEFLYILKQYGEERALAYAMRGDRSHQGAKGPRLNMQHLDVMGEISTNDGESLSP